MTLIADAIQPFIVSGLAAIAGRPTTDSFSEIIVEPTSSYGLDFDDAAQSMALDFLYPELVAGALAAECYRLSCASFQTIALVPDEVLERDSVAWSMVKLYYAAFYSGHALTRVLGESCSYFGRQQTVRLRALADALGRTPGFSVDSGLYHCTLRVGEPILDCVRARAGLGGPHESFWSIFNSCIERVGNQILAGPLSATDSQAVYSQLQDFRALLARGAASGWLSTVRNELQYRQGYGVWYPSGMRARERQTVRGWIANWNRDPMNIDLRSRRLDTLGGFVVGCTFVVSLCHAMLSRIAERSSAGSRSFVRVGPMAFINQIRA